MNKSCLFTRHVCVLCGIIFFSSSFLYAQRFRLHHLRSLRGRVANSSALVPVHSSPIRMNISSSLSADLAAGVQRGIVTQSLASNADGLPGVALPTASRKYKTKNDWLAAYRAHPEELRTGTPMFKAFKNAYQRVKKAEMNDPTVQIDPAAKEMFDIYLGHTNRHTPVVTQPDAEWLKRYREHPEEFRRGTPMYNAFRRIYHRMEKTEEKDAERSADPVGEEIAHIYVEHTQRRLTRAEWLERYREHPEELRKGTPMYNAFLNISQRTKKATIAGNPTDPISEEISRIYEENTERHTKAHTILEVYDTLLRYLQDNGAYPTRRDREYKLVYSRLHGWGKPSLSELQAKPQLRRGYESDPELNKLYKLDELARAVRDGVKPWAALETELKKDFTGLAVGEQTVLRQMDVHYDQVWHDFPEWYEQHKEHIILTQETSRVFEEMLNRTTTRARGTEDGEIVQIISDLARMKLGNIGNEISYRVIYRGEASREIQSKDFHLVAEEQGVPLQMSMRELFPQRMEHIGFWFEDGRLAGMELKEGVTPQDIQIFIDTILEKNFAGERRVRMGWNEPGRQKIYFEQIDNEGGVDKSVSLQIKVRTPTLREQRKKDPNFFYNLFGKYMP